MVVKRVLSGLMLIGLALLGSACAQESEDFLLASPATPAGEDIILTQQAPDPPEVLSICLGQEPVSLFLYGDNSLSARIIRQAIYDGPVDEVEFQPQPVILEDIPSLENGLVQVDSAAVQPGDRLVDADGSPTYLQEGTRYLPAGCFSQECSLQYQGEEAVQLNQVVITFPLLDGLAWADGEPLTAQDSFFSYQVAGQIFSTRPPKQLRMTAGYSVQQENEVVWRGLPGYQGLINYHDFFFPPLPDHLWGELSPQALLTSEQTARSPLGWGPYQIEEWKAGDHLSLSRSPRYSWGDDQAGVDRLIFRFMQDLESALAAFRAGECDLLLNQEGLAEALQDPEAYKLPDQFAVSSYHTGVWEQISFGVQSLDPTRQILADRDVRQAVAGCIDREAAAALNPGAGQVINSLYPLGDPRYFAPADSLSYQPQKSRELLEEAGWLDQDGDPDTPRTAREVEGMGEGTPLNLTLLLAGTEDPPAEIKAIAASLAGCGIGLEVALLEPETLLQPGPEGPVFGRQFDLAKFAWLTEGYPLCSLLVSSEIPGSFPDHPKAWGGTNASGYSSPEFDQACRNIMTSLPDQEGVREAYQQIQTLINQDVPVLPLYYRQGVILHLPGQGSLDSRGAVPLWNIEVLP